jgi:hypothetical protein
MVLAISFRQRSLQLSILFLALIKKPFKGTNFRLQLLFTG